jgi:tripartite-type tricarboxylate transporter receptor subunit TctC
VNTQQSRREILLASVGLGISAIGLPRLSSAQTMIDTMRIVCGYPPGSSIDLVCRKLGERLSGKFAKNVIVDIKSGAAGRLAVETVKSSSPDGSSMLITPSSTLSLYPNTFKNLSYNLNQDFSTIASVASFSFAVAVGPSVPQEVRSFSEFIAWARAIPGQAQCGNAGAGSFQHLLAMLIARECKFEWTHVPFRGGSAAMLAVASGHVSAGVTTETATLAMVQAGKVRVLASTGAERSAALANTLTFRELGFPQLTHKETLVAVVPKKCPAQVIASLTETIRLGLRDTEVQEQWRKSSLLAEYLGPTETLSALQKEHDFWEPIIKASGFTPET